MRSPRRLAVLVAIASLLSGAVAAPVLPAAASTPATHRSTGLPLGAANLPETRSSRTLAPGVTLTTIVRGQNGDPTLFWTAEVTIPSSSTDPDAQGSSLSDEAQADATRDALIGKDLPARVEQVVTPTTADIGGSLGYRVRVGQAADQAGADAIVAQVKAAGYTAASTYTGWDGNSPTTTPARGPWHLQVITIDPRRFHGRLDATYGADLTGRETTTSMTPGALAAINAGFFVYNTAAVAPGDPTGTGVYDGRLERNSNQGRPVFVSHDDARGSTVIRTTWRGSVQGGGRSLRLDGINRTPGVIQDCGGGGDDQPTALPLQGTTCTDDSEVISFDAAFGKALPSGAGSQVDLDSHGRVVAIHTARGGSVPRGGHVLQAIGPDAEPLLRLARAGRLVVTSTLFDDAGRPVHLRADESMVNGGPLLVRHGRIDVTPRQDGLASPLSNDLYYGFGQKRNPRTIAGVDGQGRTVLITADGRSTTSLGLSLSECGAVAKALGLTDAINLDGGGSTTLAVGGQVANDPSDASGQRTVGDALAVYPRR